MIPLKSTRPARFSAGRWSRHHGRRCL